jgi:DNA helicase TIP49 (TBP-interacting protein)
MLFDSEKEKHRRLEMADKLHKKAKEQKIILSPQLFDSLVNIFTETQNWRSVIDLLFNSNPTNVQPDYKTVTYLKKNLLYCFEP